MRPLPYIKSKLVFGVGVNDLVENTYVNSKPIHSYVSWKGMLERCYSHKKQERRPTYIGCTVCDEWLLFSNFKQWFDENYIKGYHLDKDILVEDNKIYSPDTCRYVPHNLNTILTDCRRARGNLPLGVTSVNPSVYNTRKSTTYTAQCNDGNKKQLCKTFKTIPEAQEWYSTTKKRIVKEQATRAFLDNAIKTDIYLALIRREF